jgi:preprotein translocase subunit SecA
LKEGEVIQHSMITKSIERAQKKVEENNFGVRKRLIEYDDVMNAQREVIYKPFKDFENFNIEVLRILSIESPVDENTFAKQDAATIAKTLYQHAEAHYTAKNEFIARKTFPIIRGVYENQSQSYENIVSPLSDGIKTLQVVVNLKRAYETQGREFVLGLEKGTALSMIDDSWKEHLREMDELKQSVQNAVYEQKDPLLVYKFESFELFKRMMVDVNKEIVSFLMRATVPNEGQENIQQAKVQAPVKKEQVQTNRTEDGEVVTEQEKPKAQPIRVEQKIGRNDPCPCGSGKKYKSCHGQ